MDIKEKLDELGTAFESFKKTNDLRLDEIKKNGVESAGTKEKLEKNEAHIQKLEAEIEKMQKAFQRTGAGNDPADTPEAKDKKAVAEYKSAINLALRKGIPLSDAQVEFAKKTMSVDSDEDGGFFVDPETNGRIVSTIFESSPIRQLAESISISSDSYEFDYDMDEAASGWVGEQEARPNTNTPKIKQIKIPVHELYANPKATQKLLDDAAVNVEAWLAGKVSSKFARDEATAFLKGNGVAKPKGILEYGVDAGTGFGQVEVQRTASATAITGDELIDLQSKLKEGYQQNANWMINRLIVASIRKLKDTNNGQYLWQPGLQAGQPNLLLGRPVNFASDMDSTLAIDKYTALYGDFKAGYLIVDRVGVRVLRDPYTSKPFVQFYTTKRVGGGVQNFEAFKILRQKSS